MGPSSKVISSSELTLESACLKTNLQKSIASICFKDSQIFCMSHDYKGYEDTYYPPLLCTGTPINLVEETGGDIADFYSNFSIDPHLLSDCLISAITYNQLNNINISGDSL